jgi:hypothetical protein
MRAKIGILLIVYLLSAVLLSGQEPSGLVLDLGFLGGPLISAPTPPTSLNLGVELSRQAHFKLFRGEDVLDAGLLNPGFNVLRIDVSGFFQASSTRTLVLELKEEGRLERKHLTLLVKLDQGSETPGETQEPKPPVSQLDKEYSLSLYVDQRLMAANRKKAVESIAFDLKLPPMPRNYNPFNPDAHRDPMTNTFSIFDALGMAAQMASKLLRKPKAASPANVLRPLRQIRVEFFRKTPQGLEQPVTATLTLAVGDGIRHPSFNPRLFVPQRSDRVGQGGLEGLAADRQQGDQQGNRSGGDEDPPLKSDAVSEVVQPVVHHIKRQRPGQDVCQHHQFQEILREV